MPIKRMNYFKGEFLNKEDFEAEQSYHVDMLRKHNENLHTWGIAKDLDVIKVTGENAIRIESGMAIDSLGRQIVLEERVDKQIPPGTTKTELYLTISYNEVPTDPRDDNAGVGSQNTRIEEKPIIEFLENDNFDPSLKLLLAKVTLDNGTISIDTSINCGRKPAGSGQWNDVAGGISYNAGNVGIGTDKPDCELHVSGHSIKLGLEKNGGGQLVIGNNPGDKGIYLEACGSADEYGNASFLTICGNSIRNIPTLNLSANDTLFGGNINVAGTINTNQNLLVQGNVGIGTTNKIGNLDVSGIISLLGKKAFQSDETFLRINQNNEFPGGTHFHSRANFLGGITTGTWWDTDPGEGNLLVQGNVGIGTTNPTDKLHIEGDGAFVKTRIFPSDDNTEGLTGLSLESREQGGNTHTWKIYTAPVGGGHGVPGNSLTFWEYGNLTDGLSPKLVLQANTGNVGIGTTNPGWPLSIRAKGVWEELVSFEDPDGNTKWHINQNVWGNNRGLNFAETGVPDGHERLFIQAGGKVGIGTINPQGRLDVYGDAYFGTGINNENHKIVIRGPNGPGDSNSHQDLAYEFAGAGSAKIQAYRGSSWDTHLQFLTNSPTSGKDEPQVRMHIDGDGNVGIGTTVIPQSKPSAKLAVFEAPPTTANIGTTEIIRLVRDVAQNIKTANCASLNIGSFEGKTDGRTRLDFNLSGSPSTDNDQGSFADKTVMSLLANGNVGIGTTLPEDALQIGNGVAKLAIGSAEYQSLRYGTSYIGFNAVRTVDGWKLNSDSLHNGGCVIYSGLNNGSLRFVTLPSTFPAKEQILKDEDITNNIKLEIDSTGTITYSGELKKQSSRNLKEEIHDLSIKEAFEVLEGLKPVKYVMKKNKDRRLQVGFIAEETHELVASADRKGIINDNIVAVLTKVIQEQQKTIRLLIDDISTLKINSRGVIS